MKKALSLSLSLSLSDSVTLKPHKFLLVLSLALSLASASFLLIAEAQAQVTRDFPMYTWGTNANGQLGRTPSVENPADRPARVEGASIWVDAAAAAGGSFAISNQGHLYSWGNAWNSAQMAQGTHPNPGTGNILFPERVGDRNDWRYVFARANGMAAISTAGHLYTWGDNIAGMLGRPGAANVPLRVSVERNWAQFATGSNSSFAITTDGALYSWGGNTNGVLGRGSTPLTPTIPTRIENRYCVGGLQPSPNDWKHVATNGQSTLAITTDGALYSWGVNASGQLGIGVTGGNRDVPTRIGIRNDWADIAKSSSSAAVICNAGNLYTFGSASAGRLGNGATSGIVNEPTQIGVGTTWAAVMGSGNHFMAFTTDGALYAWGDNVHGQLGIGVTGGNRDVPTFVIQTFGRAETPRGGGLHSTMLMRTYQFLLTKHLQKPEGTPAPDLNFRFTFERNSFNDNSTAADIARIPVIDPVVINPTMAVNPNAPNPPPAGIITLEGYADILGSITFTERGVFSWIIREDATHPSGAGANSTVVFSQAEYELRAYVRQNAAPMTGYFIYYITLHRLTDPITGDDLVPPLKVDDLIFTNLYTRTTAANQHFEIRKTIEGDFANLSDTFTFEITLTRTALCPENRTFVGRVVDVAGNPVSPPRTYTFTTGVTQNVELGHNERLIFDGANAITLGSTFLVNEQACPFHIASVRVYSYGTHQPPNPPNYVVLANTEPDQARTTNTHAIGANRNAALFTNTHQMPPPTGLIIGNAPYALVLAAGMMFAVLLATKARKRIEDLPTVH